MPVFLLSVKQKNNESVRDTENHKIDTEHIYIIYSIQEKLFLFFDPP